MPKKLYPLCRRAAAAPHIPFCSHRCAQLDLGKWLTEYYAVADHEAMDERDIEVLLAQIKAKMYGRLVRIVEVISEEFKRFSNTFPFRARQCELISI